MRRAVAVVSVACMMVAVAAAAAPAALAQQPPTYVAVEPDVEALPGTQQYSGIDGNGAAWLAEVPDDWNGDLVLYAHGFVSPTTQELQVQLPPGGLREYWLQRGFAWAASSFRANGYGVVGDAVDDTENLIGYVADATERQPGRVYLHGASLGGHVTAAAIERSPDTYAGALPVCGALGDVRLFDYFADAGLTGPALAGIDIDTSFPADYASRIVPATVAELGLGGDTTTAGYQWSRVLEQRSGGERPLFDEAFAFWTGTQAPTAIEDAPFLLGVYGGALTGGPDPRNTTFTGTEGVVYQFDDDSAVSPAEAELNEAVYRYAPQPGAEPYFPRIEGQPPVPVLSLHTIGDLFVPLSMEQVYARRVADNGLSERFVARAIRALDHCAFTPAELRTAFDDLVAWVTDDVVPAGDAITDDRIVQERSFGCQFTSETRPGLDPCPAAPTLQRLAGDDRIATAVAVSQATHDAVDEVVLARADLAADALAGAGYVGGDKALLLSRSGSLPSAVADEIARLRPTTVTLLGGEQALSSEVAAAAGAVPGVQTVERIAGPTRYGTAAQLGAAAAGGTSATGTVYVLNGSGDGTGGGWADAAAVSGLTALLGAPTLLVTHATVPAETAQALMALKPERITVVGGPDAVGAEVVRTLEDAAPVDRLAGDDRYGTSADVVDRSLASGAELQRPILATGERVPDALVAGPAAAAGGQALVLVDGTGLGGQQATAQVLLEHRSLVSELRIAGGDEAVSDTVAQSLLSAVTPPGN